MARSLTVKPEDSPSTSPLLTGFLVVAALVLLATALGPGGYTAEAPPAAPVEATP
ncbi:MAG: hypothetical protein ACON5B_08400 [Myxococcota bacterium]